MNYIGGEVSFDLKKKRRVSLAFKNWEEMRVSCG